MAKKKIIYAVSSGSYSDYGIEALFDSKEKAEEYMKHFPKEDYADSYNEIEQYELNPLQDVIRKGLQFFRVWMDKDGNAEDIRNEGASRGNYFQIILDRSTGVEYLNAVVSARDKKHAIKIVNEYRTQLIAQNQWIVVNPKP